MPTHTWQAYNFRDDDGDGRGDTWYADWSDRTARLGRPFLDRGVPPTSALRPAVPALARARRASASTSSRQRARRRRRAAAALARAYDLIVFPGHHEYVTTREYDAVERYRDLGGNLMFLSANNFFWRVVMHGRRDDARPHSGATSAGRRRR